MQKNQSSFLTFGSLMIALFAILIAMSVYVPILTIITSLIAPLPLAWYSAKFERKESLLVTVVAVIITFIIGGIVGVTLGLIVGPVGFLIGDSLRRKQTKLYMLMATGIFVLLMTAAQYIVSILVLNINLIEQFLEGIKISYEQVGNLLESANQKPETYDEMVRQFLIVLEALTPTYFIFLMFITAFIYIAVNLPILKKLKVPVPKFPKYMYFKLPKAVLWYYLVVAIISLVTTFEVGTFSYMLIINATFILRALLFLQGVSLIQYYFHIQGWPKWSAILATFLAIPLYTFTIILGVLDLGFNLRAYLKDRYKK